ALHDEEHLLFAAVAVERTRTLARRNDIVRKAQVLRAEKRADAHRIAFEFVTLHEMLELQFVDVDDSGIDHAHSWTPTLAASLANSAAALPPKSGDQLAPRGGPAALIGRSPRRQYPA